MALSQGLLRRSRYISPVFAKLLEIITLSRQHHPDVCTGDRSCVETITRFVT